MHLKEGIRLGAVWIILSLKISSGLLEAEVGIRFDSIRFDSIRLYSPSAKKRQQIAESCVLVIPPEQV
jgi:hypothetical protein